MRLLLCFLLTLAAAPAWAEWVKVSDTDVAIVYIDPSTIRKDGNLRRVWGITDLKRRDMNGEMSRRVLYEYDCKEERFRILSMTGHAGPMANGKVVSEVNNASGKWNDDASGTVGYTKACAK